MEKATFDQAQHLLLLGEQADLDCEQWQTVFGLGVLADIFEAVKSGKQIDREVVRKALGLDILFEFVDTAVIPATCKFVARDKFVVDASDKVGVKIAWLVSNFEEWFLDKIEEPAGESELCCHGLLKPSLDGPIIAELGGESKKVETTLAELFSLLKKQGNGEDGVLLTNGYANIFYSRDINGELRAVSVCWRGVGWSVHACSVERPYRWRVGDRVFSRNSSS